MRGHTGWCAEDHRCGLGEHKSEPLAFPASYGSLVATRILTRAGSEVLEVRANIRLGWTAKHGDQAAQLLAAMDLATRSVLAGDTDALAPMIERVSVWQRRAA